MRKANLMEAEVLTAPYPSIIINEEFTVDAAAPIAGSRTAVPGPGVLQIGDSGSALSLISGEAVPSKASAGTNNPGIWMIPGLARIGGRTLKSRLKNISAYGADVNKTFSPALAWVDTAGATSVADLEGISYWIANTKFQIFDSISATSWISLETCLADTYNVMAIVLRQGGGAFHIVDGKLIGITRLNQDPNVHPNLLTISSSRNAFQTDYFKVADLGSPWDSDFGICDSTILRNLSVSDAFTHQANGHIEFTIVTLPSSGNILLTFKRTDANNLYRINITTAGNVILEEMVAGTPTTRSSISGCLANDRIMVSFNGSVISLYRDRPGSGVTNTTAYAASVYTTQTAGILTNLGTGGVLKDLACYPYTLSGKALAGINSII